ncbi:hypothetical protein SGUI_2622 [Serinicoccus hydrothermalis]|uniref:Uncharacterized protein n=1 Tax=Serinicoccus hydrothermalis TaxID=1758689 RepID=A0A1B1NF20_9MICO|nr:hypothetical protein [Serinicoccus hydrothermalis]ANS80018.1 hypothetical protein SGUI_2622 [Serinicoccus hydrothermalis]
MSSRVEQVPLLGFVLPLLAVMAMVSAAATPDHLLVALAAAAVVALAADRGALPLRAQVVSAHHRSEVCRCAGVRSSDPDRSGWVRPRAPGQA